MEKIKTLKMLLSGGNIKFGNPVDDFKKKLSEGHYNSDNVQMKKLLKKLIVVIAGSFGMHFFQVL